MSAFANIILISERRLASAMWLRTLIAFGVIAYFAVGCQQSGAGAGGGIPILFAIMLLQCVVLALRRNRERGMWMMYTFMAIVTTGLYLICELQPGGPAPSATKVRIAHDARDAAVGGWLLFLSLRLMASAAVVNFRRFRRTAAKRDAPLP